MPLGKHSRNKNGTLRRERGDSTAGKLREVYPEFSEVRSDAKLKNIKKNLSLPDDASIKKVREALRELNK